MMHTFRLLKMAKEIAVEGRLNVERPDRKYLLDIKNGKFDYEDLLEDAETLKSQLSELYKKSKLPDYPDMVKINSLLIDIRSSFYKRKKQAKS